MLTALLVTCASLLYMDIKRVNLLLLPAAAVPSRSCKVSSVDTVASEASKSTAANDSPKADNRKRTRQSLQSPAPEASASAAASTPSSGKRARRI